MDDIIDGENPTKEGVACPKCGEVFDHYVRHGRSPLVECPNGCRFGFKSMDPEDYDRYVERIEPRKKVTYAEPITPMRRSEPPRDNGPFPHIPTDIQILDRILMDYDIADNKKSVIMKRVETHNGIDPSELFNLMLGLQAKSREISQFIINDYTYALRKRDEEKENIIRALGDSPEPEDDGQEQEPDEFDKMLKMIKIMKELNPPNLNQGNVESSSEIRELKAQVERLRDENQKKEIESLKESMANQTKLLQSQIEGAKGYKEDSFRLFGEGFNRWMDAIDNGSIKVGDLRKTPPGIHRGRYNEHGQHADSNEEIQRMMDKTSIGDLVHDEDLREVFDEPSSEQKINYKKVENMIDESRLSATEKKEEKKDGEEK